jgi:hypothetical protein
MFHCTHENFHNLYALSKLVLNHWDLRYKEVYIKMAVADLISAWIVPFIAPIILASVDRLNDIKEILDRLKDLSEARERDGGVLIYQRVPTPRVLSAAVHLDG